VHKKLKEKSITFICVTAQGNFLRTFI